MKLTGGRVGREVAGPRENWVLRDLEDGRFHEWRRWYLPHLEGYLQGVRTSDDVSQYTMAPWNLSLEFLALDPHDPG